LPLITKGQKEELAELAARTMDTLSKERRSANMRRIGNKNTAPELKLRSLIHGLGYRFRLHRKDLPGRPDLVFPGRRKIIFVHGCFWHQHPGCIDGRTPRSKLDYWIPKLRRNQSRDVMNQDLLEKMGWKVLTVWECDLKHVESLTKIVKSHLGRVGLRRRTYHIRRVKPARGK
jgi:DNA mismatch endonuclease, patch repair protein